MKRVLLVLMMMCMGAAWAGELQDANQLMRRGAFAEAAAILTRLADAGNPEAQLRLGEMFWYGRGTAVDAARAADLFTKAAKGGSPEATAALGLMAQREKRLDEIAYWIKGYDGAELRSDRFACVPLELPVYSKTKQQIRTLNEKAEAWRACYNDFVANLNAQAPVGKRIPIDIEVLMTDAEIDQARTNLSKVYSDVSAQANAMAAAMIRDYSAWITGTDAFVTVRAQSTALWQMDKNKKFRDSYANVSGYTPISTPVAQVGRK
jgi:TPR repeat protein